MKKLILLTLLSTSKLLYSQTNTFPTSGNVGVGTVSPQYKFQIQQTSAQPAMMIGGGNSGKPRLQVYGLDADANAWMGLGADMAGGPYEHSIYFPTGNSTYGGKLTIGDYNGTSYYARMTVLQSGRIGIGTNVPQSIMHVVGDAANIDAGNSNQYGQGLLIEGKTGGRSAAIGAQLEFVIPANTDGLNPWGQGRIITVAGNPYNGHAVGKMIIGTRRMFNKKGSGEEWFYGDDIVVDGTGNVGIGTLTPNEKLSVKGKIRAQEIKVETANWPDYVFAKDYKLPSLQETEQHIKDKGHLPGIPSAEEVKTKGVDLGEMNAKLLQKIEELTLHLIEIKKELDDLKKK